MSDKSDSVLAVGKYSASLSLTEIGLGSFLHGLSIPFAGQLLSLNQIAIMSRASSIQKDKLIALKISLISSLLKSLSPAGKKLTPMLAILSQGLFFSTGLSLFGLNPIGFFVAIALSAAWAFIQPLLLLYFMFGKTLLDVVEYFQKDFKFLSHLTLQMTLILVSATYLIKLTTGLFLAWKLSRMSETQFEEIQSKFNVKTTKTLKRHKESQSQLLNAFSDLLQPLFIVSFLLTAVFIYHSQSSSVQLIWTLMRPLAIGVLIFYLIRIYPADKLVSYLENKGFKETSRSLNHALEIIKKNREE